MADMADIVAIARRYERASPDTTIPPGAGPVSDDEALMKMQRDFPGHRIWREIIPGRTVYVARSHHPTAHPHTVVTPDLRELHAALTASPPTPPRGC
jgi:hypothetical protein